MGEKEGGKEGEVEKEEQEGERRKERGRAAGRKAGYHSLIAWLLVCTELSALHTAFHSILITTLGDSNSCHSHFTVKAPEAQRG